MYGHFIAVAALALGMGSSWSPTLSAGTQVSADTVTVTNIVDGATVDVSDDNGAVYRVRALGVVPPEVAGNVECWGVEAADFARRTLADQHVQVVPDPTKEPADKMGRALRYILLPERPERPEERNYSIMAAEAGVAWAAVPVRPSRFDSEIAAAEQKAKSARIGLWGPPCNGKHQAASATLPRSPGYGPNLNPPQPAPQPDPTPARGVKHNIPLEGDGYDKRPNWESQVRDNCKNAGYAENCLTLTYTFQVKDAHGNLYGDR